MKNEASHFDPAAITLTCVAKKEEVLRALKRLMEEVNANPYGLMNVVMYYSAECSEWSRYSKLKTSGIYHELLLDCELLSIHECYVHGKLASYQRQTEFDQ